VLPTDDGESAGEGRIERAWGTFQDRPVVELRLADAGDIAAADRVLTRFVPRFNRRFAVPAANPEPAQPAVPRSNGTLSALEAWPFVVGIAATGPERGPG
jgi:hypothetical protein